MCYCCHGPWHPATGYVLDEAGRVRICGRCHREYQAFLKRRFAALAPHKKRPADFLAAAAEWKAEREGVNIGVDGASDRA